MNRLFAAVAISALALSGAAYAADAPTTVQKAQAPAVTTTSPTKSDTSVKKSSAHRADKKAGSSSDTAISGSPEKPAAR